MEYSEQVGIIANIENNVAVDLITYKNTRVWPIIRLLIWQNIFDGPQQGGSRKKRKSNFQRLIRFFSNKFLTPKNNYQSADALFLVAPNERRAYVQGAYYSPIANSLREVLSSMNISSAMLDLDKKRLPVYGDTHFIDGETIDSPIRHKILGLWKRYALPDQETITGWDDLKKYMQTSYSQYLPRAAQVINYYDHMTRYENIFMRILKKVRPKIGFLVCYYHPAAMGYIKACKNLGIKTIDIQHGDQYGMYRNWNNLPPSGYELLPSGWWCWGQESAAEINKWSVPAHPNHKAFVGGNPWISRFINTSGTGKNSDHPARVLVALTAMPYPVDTIISAIKDSPSIQWIIRPHPAMMHLVDKFKDLGPSVNIEDSPKVSLFDLLGQVDFMITPCSTVAYEALVLQVHPIITHADGLEKFKSYITKGFFSFASSGNDICAILKKNRSEFNFHEDIPYMETSKETIEHTLSNLLRT